MSYSEDMKEFVEKAARESKELIKNLSVGREKEVDYETLKKTNGRK